jgi:hypothetical protein
MELPIHSITQEYLDRRLITDVTYRGENNDQLSKYITYDNENKILAEFTQNLTIQEKKQLFTDLVRLSEYCSTYAEHELNSYSLRTDIPDDEIQITRAWVDRYRIDRKRYQLLLDSLDSLESKEFEKKEHQNAIEKFALIKRIGILECTLFRKQEYTERSKHKVLAKILGVTERTASKYYRMEADVITKITNADNEVLEWLNTLTKS